jgi:ABC-2 type transport system permease protein
MTANANAKAPISTTSAPTAADRATTRKLPAGWRVVASKEIGDHVLSVRFLVLLLVLGIAVAIPLYFASDQIRNAAQAAQSSSIRPAIFLALFSLGPTDIAALRVDNFVAIVAPLLGIAFAFDAVNSERSEGTLPRLLSQPIYRDDVINGKFAAGLVVIGLVLVSVVLFIAGFGMFRLGIIPDAIEITRIVAWLAITFLYVALWLAFGLLLSVVIRRAATSALVGFGVWLLLTIFGPLITTLLSGLVAAPAGATVEQQISAAHAQELVTRILPGTLYHEAALLILQPTATSTSISTPTTIGQIEQAQWQVPGLLSVDQSLLLVWPQIVAIVALTVLCFAAAYALFMRQEVRA